jgi:glycosyltransferase involved in cell wall biosynthesis
MPNSSQATLTFSKTGIDFALEEGADIIVTFDADGQHKAEEIKRLTAPIEKGEVEACLGSRFLDKKTKVPFTKLLTLKAGILFTRIFSGIKLTGRVTKETRSAIYCDDAKNLLIPGDRTHQGKSIHCNPFVVVKEVTNHHHYGCNQKEIQLSKCAALRGSPRRMYQKGQNQT